MTSLPPVNFYSYDAKNISAIEFAKDLKISYGEGQDV